MLAPSDMGSEGTEPASDRGGNDPGMAIAADDISGGPVWPCGRPACVSTGGGVIATDESGGGPAGPA